MMKNKGLNGLKINASLFVVLSVFIGFNYIFSSCASSEIADSGDVNQDAIYHYYAVTYDANSSKSYDVEAQFRFGGNKGTTLRLTDHSKVYVNGNEMKEESNVLRGCFYTLSLDDGNEFEFKFVDTEEKEYINKCKIYSAELKNVDDIIADLDYEVKWIGLPLASNESMVCTIEDNEGNIATGGSDIVGSQSVNIDKDDMETLMAGNAEIYLTRTSFVDADEVADEGGKIYTEYKSEKKSVKIKRLKD